jgi:hypothetical protein
VALLEQNRHVFNKHPERLDNLLSNLKKQVQPSGNFYNRTLILFNIPQDFEESHVKALFKNTSRIISMDIKGNNDVDHLLNSFEFENNEPYELPVNITKRACIVGFSSNSAARKTLETLIDQETYKFYWINTEGKVVGHAIPFKKKQFEVAENSEENRSEHISVDHHANFVKEQKTECSPSQKTLESSNDISSEDSDNQSDPWKSTVFPVLPIEETEDSLSNSAGSKSFFDHFILEDHAWHHENKSYDSPLLKRIEQKQEEIKRQIENNPFFIQGIINRIKKQLNS